MTTLRISLSDSMRTFVDEQVAKGGYGTASEFIRKLIREAQERAADQERLEALLLEGLNSGPPIEATEEYWRAKRARLAEHQKLEELRREIAIGIEQADRGEVAPLDIEAIKAEGRRRLAERQKNARDIDRIFNP